MSHLGPSGLTKLKLLGYLTLLSTSTMSVLYKASSSVMLIGRSENSTGFLRDSDLSRSH